MAASNFKSSVSRFIDVGEESRKLLQPLEGYQSLPLVSVEEAIEPIIEFCPDVQRRAYIAKGNCDSPTDNLTEDESASIYLYTSEWEPRDECLYVVLNSVLRSQNRRKLILPWFLFLKLLLTALFKLPSCTMTVFRGVTLDLRKQYEIGKTYTWWGLSSCTESINVLESDLFLGTEGKRTMFNIECFNGKKIHQHSSIESEDEVLLLPASQFIVKSHFQPSKKDPDLFIIHLKQIEPPFPLLEWPPSKDIPSKSITKDPSSALLKSAAGKSSSNYSGYKLPPSVCKKIEQADKTSKNNQFVNGGATKHNVCGGRLCANCCKCRDWYFTGDRETWNWIRNSKNWKKKDWLHYCNNHINKLSLRRDGASCLSNNEVDAATVTMCFYYSTLVADFRALADFLPDFEFGFDGHCLCEDNICP